jgi:hypothetical protein
MLRCAGTLICAQVQSTTGAAREAAECAARQAEERLLAAKERAKQARTPACLAKGPKAAVCTDACNRDVLRQRAALG